MQLEAIDALVLALALGGCGGKAVIDASGGGGSAGSTSTSTTTSTTTSSTTTSSTTTSSTTTSSTTTSSTTTTSTSTPCPTQIGYTDPTCDACFRDNCCSEALACEASADCINFLNCRASCSDQACIDQCEADHPAGKAHDDAMLACVVANCPAQCSY